MIHLNKDISSLTIIPMISLIALCKMRPEENYNLQCFFFSNAQEQFAMVKRSNAK